MSTAARSHQPRLSKWCDMRHKNAHRKLSRNTSHRRALLRNLVTDFLDHGRLMTTLPKAKEVRPLAEKMITLGKRRGDGADLAIIELLGSELEVKKAERAEKAKEKEAKTEGKKKKEKEKEKEEE